MTSRALVLVHGRDQGREDPAKLEDVWRRTFKGGLTQRQLTRFNEIEIRFPFYGRKLDDLTARMMKGVPTDIRSKGDGRDVDTQFLVFEQLVLERMAEAKGLKDADILKEMPSDVRDKGPGSFEWVQALLRALDKLPGISAAIIEQTTRDVFLYLTNKSVRDAINEIVAPTIAGPCVVVGHSLGSIVTYWILKNLKQVPDVRLFCTIGSPLGITGIRENVMPLIFPKGVKEWFNAFDQRDVVALYPLDGKRYPLRPAIINDSSLQNETENHHGIIEYLNKRPVSERIFNALFSE